MNSTLPNDPVMLLSVVNTNLRDHYDSLEEFCRAKNIAVEYIINKLSVIDYSYDKKLNKFI